MKTFQVVFTARKSACKLRIDHSIGIHVMMMHATNVRQRRKRFIFLVLYCPEGIIKTNFIKIVLEVSEILQFFRFSRLPSWIFKILKFDWLTMSGAPRGIALPSLVNI